MRLADVVLRRGHLSDQALIEVWTSGVRPSHLDTCGRCAGRALEMSRWLEDVRDLGRLEADLVLTDERMDHQYASVMDRLAELDRPSKVISFPAASLAERAVRTDRRIGPGWLAAAAAAGLMIGIISIELSHLWPGTEPAPLAATQAHSEDEVDLLDGVFARPTLGSLSALDEMTPRFPEVMLASNR